MERQKKTDSKIKEESALNEGGKIGEMKKSTGERMMEKRQRKSYKNAKK